MTSTYRADIEGLRAIAILAVVACHAKIPYFEGGFVGVDIFFVLSGYLITGLLIREIELTGKIDLPSFYARRLKRLLPGLALMVMVSCLVAYILLSPAEQTLESISLFYAALWSSNFGYIFADTDYFRPNTIDFFLHTWSLGVEEQFYLVWPLLLLLFSRTRSGLLNWLIFVVFACLGLSIVLTRIAPNWGFYFMPSRGWQFALGGIVWLLTTNRIPGAYHSAKAHMWAGYVGTGLVLTSVLLINEWIPYPGVAALAPSLGTALILYAQNSPVGKALSIKPMLAIGRISYSWYLWHWPVLILGTTLLHRTDTVFQLMLVLMSLLLAVVAYLTVESPVRRAAFSNKAILSLSLTVMISGALISKNWGVAALELALTEPQRSLNLLRQDLPQINRRGCDGWYQSADIKACIFSDGNFTKTAVLIGDSVGVQWFSAFSEYAEGEWRLIALTKSACPIADEPIYYGAIKGMYTVCEEWRNAAIEYIAELKPDAIFIGSASAYPLRDWKTATQRILSRLSHVASKIYIIQATPTLETPGIDCLGREEWQPDYFASLTDCESTGNVNISVIAALDAAAAEFENVRTLDFNDLVCPDGVCKAKNQDVVVFRDSVHVTNQFVRSIAPQIRDRIIEAD